MQSEQSANQTAKKGKAPALAQIETKIRESDSILIALSKNPTIDELATAVGLGMFIDKMGKHATVIYSGQTPNAIAFLNPEQQIETNTNSLQDFIIAINKDKADHLRYKLDGDYVKVYITPYRTTITENDLEFSHGDYNVDLVIALNVENPDHLDHALSEHGRIMHDATIINIAAGVPGQFGEIQWSEPAASSVAEMVADLMSDMKDSTEVDGEIATAVLTGIVAATDRFSNERTTPETMAVASRLMSLGADQQLISANIKEDQLAIEQTPQPAQPVDPSLFSISREEPAPTPSLNIPQPAQPTATSESAVPTSASTPVIETPSTPPTPVAPSEETVSASPVAPTPEPPVAPTFEPTPQPQATATFEPAVEPQSQAVQPTPEPQPAPSEFQLPSVEPAQTTEPTLPPVSSDFMNNNQGTSTLDKDYGSMMEEELKKADEGQSSYLGGNPALMAAPEVADAPEENHIPEMNFDRPVDMSDTSSEQPAGNDESFLASSPMKTLSPDNASPEPTPVVEPLATESTPVVEPSTSPVATEPELSSSPASTPETPNLTEENPLPMPDFSMAPPPTPPAFPTDALPPVQEPTPVEENPLVHPELQALETAQASTTQPTQEPQPAKEPESQISAQPNFDPGSFQIPGM